MTDIKPHQAQNSPVSDHQVQGESARMTLSAPLENQHHMVSLSQGSEILFDFDFGNVVVESAGQHLLFRFPEGGTITLENINTLIDSNQPPMAILQDGLVLSFDQIMASAQIPENQVAPAAGESGPNSGGVSEYEDNPGSILDGVDRLDGLDFEQTQGVTFPDLRDFGENANDRSLSNGAQADAMPLQITIEDIGNINDNTPTISGTAEPGSTIIIEVGDTTMTTTADANGAWTVTIADNTSLSDGAYTITGTATDAQGNFSTDTAHVEIDTTVYATITLDVNITTDDVVAATEFAEEIPISGHVGGDVQDGDMVTLTVNGNTYSGAVHNGAFSIDVPGAELAADPDHKIEASVTTTDSFGNTTTAVNTETYEVNHAPQAVDNEVGGVEDSPIAGNILSNDSDLDGDSLSIDPSSVGRFATSGGGTIEISSDGSYTYTPALNFNGTDTFDYTLTDGSLTDTATLRIQVDSVNDAPVVQSTTVHISEEGISGGIQDENGSVDTTDLSTINGRVSITDIDSDAIESVTLSAPSIPITSNGESINWSGEGTSTLTGTAGGQDVLTIHIDNSGDYEIVLKAPVDHSQAGEDLQSLNIGVTVSDGTAISTASISIQLEDDSPVAGHTVNSISVPETDTNVMIMLDVSGSMNSSSGVQNMSRMALAKQAIGELLDSYDGYGDVSVNIVTFSNNANVLSDSWVSVEEAKDLLDGINARGMTNYDAALNTVRLNAFEADGKIDGAQNVSYFFSDGYPNRPSNSRGIDPDTEEPLWTKFLEDNEITSYALGMGNRVSQSAMNPIAYDGAAQNNADATVVKDLSQLSSVLLNTVSPPTVGELMNGDPLHTGSAIGADDGYLHALTVDGNTYIYHPDSHKVEVSQVGPDTYTFDSANDVLTINTFHGGVLTVDLETGSYTYRAPATLGKPITEQIEYTLRDYDGDTDDGRLTLQVSRDNGTVVHLNGTDSADVINGTDAQDLIAGHSGDDLLYGNDGHDTLEGGGGNDILVGGQGDDLLIGGSGDDTITGNTGGDTFIFSANGGEGNDIITDFDVTDDVIRLTDVLDVEGTGSDIDIKDLLQDGGQNVAANVMGADVELTISHGNETTVVTLTGINANHDFTGDTTLQQLIDHGLNIDTM